MTKIYTKIDDSTIEISENVLIKHEFSLEDLISQKVSLQKAINATQKSLDTLITQMDSIDADISEAKKLGLK